ncbi:glycosyltransferase family 4 protein [Sinorhizobium sp. BG8]|uniref:glycosyltransferase family 4 protein n=1 Tax=Sinorhizobium sp. BG8 TaxID=2613773 RepID=UPI00193D18A0|nr:glycosyltransferase family 4 protein [Sinorhizobium sp. BG8]QRM53879.1 glycosyltransferase family 4 protein [Sinorhizobium sp. BG8]
MRIAFYSPLKSPRHPVPSGDRLMARQIVGILQSAGHELEVASEFRSFSPSLTAGEWQGLLDGSHKEKDRLAEAWEAAAPPDLWFTYHPYYKAPDLIGPDLCRRFSIPYVTAECSYSQRRNQGFHAKTQDLLLQGLELAAVNICFTARDRAGLEAAAPGAAFATLPPFIDSARFLERPLASGDGRLVAVAMMRSGDKFDSYVALAKALAEISHLPWTLSVVGDGQRREEVKALYSRFAPDRIEWQGEKTPDEIAEVFSASSIYVWPGHGEAYGLAYLEAQASGLPVVAERTAGVSEVVRNGETGFLTPERDTTAYAAAIAGLLTNSERRRSMAEAARRFVGEERSLAPATARLAEILESHLGRKP